MGGCKLAGLASVMKSAPAHHTGDASQREKRLTVVRLGEGERRSRIHGEEEVGDVDERDEHDIPRRDE